MMGNDLPARADMVTYRAELDGAQAVPPTISGATGSATIVVNTETLEAVYHVQYSGLESPEFAAHFHNGPVGRSGPPRFTLALGSPKDGVWAMDEASYDFLVSELIFVLVHTDAFFDGEIRGQFYLDSTVEQAVSPWGMVKAMFR